MRFEKKLGKIAKSKVGGRMPERSEAISGDESKGLTPVSTAQQTKPKSSPSQKIARAKPAKTPARKA